MGSTTWRQDVISFSQDTLHYWLSDWKMSCKCIYVSVYLIKYSQAYILKIKTYTYTWPVYVYVCMEVGKIISKSKQYDKLLLELFIIVIMINPWRSKSTYSILQTKGSFWTVQNTLVHNQNKLSERLICQALNDLKKHELDLFTLTHTNKNLLSTSS